MSKEYRYTEIFRSLQGEGMYTGVNTAWLRFFMCNLECRGFGQPEPANPESYYPVGQTIDITDITSLDDVPVHEYGCDSAYSVAKQYRNLAMKGTAAEIADKITAMLANDFNPDGLFLNPHTGLDTHMAFTGGEPMMQQPAMIDIMEEFNHRSNPIRYMTIETNGTRNLDGKFGSYIAEQLLCSELQEVFWSISPKLKHVSGEDPKKAIKPAVLAAYADTYDHGQLKFVLNNDPTAWRELHLAIKKFRDVGVDWPVYIMPVGGLKEDQECDATRRVVERALYEGFHVSGRLHAHIFGNEHNT
tara:strand:- start:77457 stop:78362 length:906 start_codon:yes stop_codon:yes gene_type:complete